MDEAIEFSLYAFSASAPLAEDGMVTHLHFSPPVAPEVITGISPTITRRFYADAKDIKREAPEDRHQLPPEPGGRDQSSVSRPPSCPGTPRQSRSPVGRSSTSIPSPSAPPSVAPLHSASCVLPSTTPPIALSRSGSRVMASALRSSAPSRSGSRAPSVSLSTAAFPPDNWADLLPTSKVATRSQSRSTPTFETTGASTASVPGGDGMPLQSVKYFPDASSVELRYPVQGRKCQRTEEEKEKNVGVGEFRTRWFESWADSIPSFPPSEMANHRELQHGDLFCHWTPTSWQPQMWLWCDGGDNRPCWMAVFPGHPHLEDDRRLGLTGNHRPSWVCDVWFRKRQVNQKVQHTLSERISAKKKGKQRAV